MMESKIKEVAFTINYKKESVVFNKTLFGKKKMSLKEFAITVLQMEPLSTEIIAMYIGKLGFDVYNSKGKIQMMVTKKRKNGIEGKLKTDEGKTK